MKDGKTRNCRKFDCWNIRVSQVLIGCPSFSQHKPVLHGRLEPLCQSMSNFALESEPARLQLRLKTLEPFFYLIINQYYNPATCFVFVHTLRHRNLSSQVPSCFRPNLADNRFQVSLNESLRSTMISGQTDCCRYPYHGTQLVVSCPLAADTADHAHYFPFPYPLK